MGATRLITRHFGTQAVGACWLLLLAACDERGASAPRQAPASRPGPAVAALTAARMEPKDTMNRSIATFGGGCFWGVEARFRETPGVTGTAVGYAGGKGDSPTYKEVCTDRTGHAEVVQVEFDPNKLSYEKLLDVFWACHDPTQVNRQGPDVGTQYRTVIFFHTPEQEKVARASKEKLAASGKHSRPIATEILPAPTFWRAEEYHQQYLEKRGLSSCHTGG